MFFKQPVVQIIAPSLPAGPAERLDKVVEVLTGFGAKVFRPKVTTTEYSVYAGTAAERADALIEAISNPETNILWAFRGWAGAMQVVDELERRGFTPTGSPKILIGYSDTTALIAWWEKQGWPAIHGPVAGTSKELFPVTGSSMNKEVSLKDTLDLITGDSLPLTYSLQTLYSPHEQQSVTAQLTGGCISIVVDTRGTATQQDAKGKILFLENYFKREPLDIVREMLAFLRSGMLHEVKAIFFGNLNLESEYLSPEQGIRQMTTEIVDFCVLHGVNVPIVYSPNFGHTSHNYPLPFYMPATLDVAGKQATLCFG